MNKSSAGAISLHPTRCAICDTLDAADELYGATFDTSSFNERIFSARRVPDRIHYRFVRCRECGLVRADPAADPEALSDLYARSRFDYGSEVPFLKRTYSRYLAKLGSRAARLSLLEIGCGSGFMLEEALAMGIRSVRGVEPSREAAAAAHHAIRDLITVGAMRPHLFRFSEFDTVCLFQVLDHIPDPNALFDEVRNVLQPGGIVLVFHHNVDSVSAGVLGEHSPIFDIEHCYLYSLATTRALLEKHGFSVLECGPAANTLTVRHLVHLSPLPRRIKKLLGAATRLARLEEVQLKLMLGNLYAIAQKS
jgi:SAM-dependent methyltransferase